MTVDIPLDDEIGGHSLPPRGVERFNEGHPPSSSAPTPSPSLGQTRGAAKASSPIFSGGR